MTMLRFGPIFLFLLAAPAFAQDRHFGDAGDMSYIPIAPGLNERPEEAGGFIGGGSVGTWVVAEGESAPDSVAQFYLERLPALGWRLQSRRDGGLAFTRPNDSFVDCLVVQVLGGDGTTKVRISETTGSVVHCSP